MSTTTANIAFAPTRKTSLYDTLGVDLLEDRDLAQTGETAGAAEFLEWIEGADQRGEDEGGEPLAQAEELLHAAGYRVVGEWDTYSHSEYAIATIERF